MQGGINWSDLNVLIPLGSVIVGSVLWVVRSNGALKDQLTDFKLEVARDYASLATLEKFESRLLATVEKLGDRLEKLQH